MIEISIGRCSRRQILGLLLLISLPFSFPVLAYSPGKDGVGSITTANTVINTYYTVTDATRVTGDTTVTLNSVTGLSVGDVLMIHQAQGATIDSTDTAAYGSVTSLNNVGHHELVSVLSISGNTVTIKSDCAATGLRYAYTSSGKIQAVRVPQYSTLTISGAGSITSTPWNGTRGGIVAAIVDTMAIIGGAGINVRGQGFRGGVVHTGQTVFGTIIVSLFRTTNALNGAEKGEGIAGFQTEYDALNGRYGRGAPANGGGGGNEHNAGGGGGANGNNSVAYNGLGNPSLAGTGSTVAVWTSAWDLEGGTFSTNTSSGGGRGGYTFSNSNQNAGTLAPGANAWGGDHRNNVGGRGGRPLTNAVTASTINGTRLYFGGGGGAGEGNNTANQSGANGGGIVYLIAGTVSGSGTIDARGSDGLPTVPGHNDAPGGGGGGGSVVISASTSGIAINTDGGTGGNQLITNAEAEGPGGGGGGGFVSVSGITPSLLGGGNGATASSSLTEFTPNGSTRGAAGNSAASSAVSALPICPNPVTDFSVTKSNGVVLPATLTSGQTTTYTLVVTNTGPSTVSGALLRDDPGAVGLNITAVACSSFTGSTSLPLAANVTIANLIGPGIPMPSMAPASTITCTVTATVTATGF